MDANNSGTLPTREELNAELLEVPEPPEQPEALNEPAYEDIVAVALRHVRGRRGGDLVSVILVGSGARHAVTAHSDIDLIALVKGQAEGHEIVRIADRLADIRYRGGATSYLEVLDADTRLYLAELVVVEANLAELAELVGLYRALGGGWKP